VGRLIPRVPADNSPPPLAGEGRGGGRIVLVSHSREVGGAELHVERLAGYLVGELEPAYRLELVCRPDPVLDAWAERMAAAGVVVHRLGLRAPRDLWRMGRILGGARLVHIHLAHPVGKYQWVAALAARITGRRIIATHHLAPDIRGLALGERSRELWFSAVRLMLRVINHHIAVSEYAKRILTSVYGVSPERVSVIYVGTDPRRFAPVVAAERAQLREQLFGGLTPGLSPDASLVCSVARLSPQKGLQDLVEAARQLKDDLPLARYVLIGDGEWSSKLRADIAQSGLDGIVRLAGNLPPPEVARWLQAADVFVLPSHFEGGPATALMEAMAAGCAVVGTRVSGSDELIPGPDFGVLVEARQPEALADAIRRLLQDGELRARLGRQARERVVSGFDIRTCHAQTLELYRSMLAR
jgi:glycosyltransferase involved in cell wall biosynthesis